MQKIEQKIEDFTKSVPEEGMHEEYLIKASQIQHLYIEALTIMEGPKTLEKQRMLDDIYQQICDIVD